MNQKSVRSKLRGNIEALHVLAQGASSRFEFIFACVEAKQTSGLNHNQRDMRLIDTINKILASYKSAELYREIKLRTALFEGNELIMLKEEKVYSKVTGVWNLSADQGSLGNFILTSVRVTEVTETESLIEENARPILTCWESRWNCLKFFLNLVCNSLLHVSYNTTG